MMQGMTNKTKKSSKPSFTSKWVWITPELAKQWLKKDEGTQDRNIRSGHIASMAEKMSAGNWVPTHQGIAFDTAGHRLDGQNRLHAIVKSGVSVWMSVYHDVPRKTAGAIDTAKNRHLQDMINILYPNADEVSGGASQLVVSMHMGHRYRKRLSRDGQLEFFAKYRAPMEWAVKLLPKGRDQGRIGRAGIRAAVARAKVWAGTDDARLAKIKNFCEIMRDGQGATTAERQVVRLRDWVLRNTNYAGSTANVETYSKTARTLYDFVNNKAPTDGKLRPSVDNYFPLPSDETPVIAP